MRWRPESQPRWVGWVLLTLFLVTTISTTIFALRTSYSFLLLRSAYDVGVPDAGSVRPWMTLRYVAATYRVPEASLIARLGLSPETAAETNLRLLAEQDGLSPFDYVQQVQRAVADVAPMATLADEHGASGWLGATSDRFLSALLSYGYPALGLILLFGAIGLPLPTGLSTALAGSLAAQGKMNWAAASALAVSASVLGDAVGYGLGRALGREFLERRGRWLGYTEARRAQVERLFDRWGLLTVLLTRTLVSHLSSVVNLLAGVGRYRLLAFLVIAVVGRLLWTTGYLGLGYAVGQSLEAATEFLKNLTGLLVSLALLVGLGLAILSRSRAASALVK